MTVAGKRCVIFFFDGYIGVAPTIVNFAKAMAAEGYDVTVYANPTPYADPGELGPAINTVFVRGNGRVLRLVAKTTAYLPAVAEALFAARATQRELIEALKSPSKTVYLGVDMSGAIAAFWSSLLLRRKYAFLSLELRIRRAQLRGVGGLIARMIYRRSSCVVVQGQDRLEILTRSFRWQHPTVFFLPNSPYSRAAEGSTHDRLDYVRGTLHISPSKRIALQAGMIQDGTCCPELAKGFSLLSDWALVLHERRHRSRDEPYLRGLCESNCRNLFLSLNPLPYDRIDELFRGIDVGLAFYKPSGPSDDNFARISSSGKLPHYLKHGKPVLVSRLPAFLELVESYECGIAISNPADPEEIGAALERISNRYKEFSQGAIRCFEERFDFGKRVAPLTKFLDELPT